MKIASWTTLIYGLLVLIGGLMGYIKAASLASLMWGTISGAFLVLLSIGIFKEKLFSAYLAILLTLILDAFFTYRFLLSFKFLPAGLMSLISTSALLLDCLSIQRQFKKKK